MNTLFPLTLTDRLQPAADFYRTLFGFRVVADVGWYVHLRHPDNDAIQIAFIVDDHASVPASHRRAPGGVVITLEVDDAAAHRDTVAEAGHRIHVELRDEEWGQRHFITEDPTGLLVDVVQPIDPSPEFLQRHGSPDTLGSQE